MAKIRLAIVGTGNCASSLLQGLEYYRHASGPERRDPVGLMHYDLGGYKPEDIELACAFDIDARKVGRPLEEASFAPPNNTITIWRDLPKYGVRVDMGEVLDGVARSHGGLSARAHLCGCQRAAGRYRTPAARERRRGDALLPAGRQSESGRALYARVPRDRRQPDQLHAGVHRLGRQSGRRSSASAKFRRSATT